MLIIKSLVPLVADLGSTSDLCSAKIEVEHYQIEFNICLSGVIIGLADNEFLELANFSGDNWEYCDQNIERYNQFHDINIIGVI